MANQDRTRRYLCSVLMEMCETRKLSDITVTSFIEESGVARSTFYHYFADMDDLICCTATLPLRSGKYPFCDIANTRAGLEYTMRFKGFFCQLPFHSGQNAFRAADAKWLSDIYCDIYLKDVPPEEAAFKEGLIKLFCLGSVELTMDWYASNMAMPLETLLGVIYDSAPAFIKESTIVSPCEVEGWPQWRGTSEV